MTRCRRYGCAAPAVVEGYCRPHGQAMAITRMRVRDAARPPITTSTTSRCPAHPSEPLWECVACEEYAEQRRQEVGDV